MTPSQIREARLALGLTQTEFGILLHAKLRTVQDWEAGKRNMQPATKDLLRRIMTERGIAHTPSAP